MATAQQIIRRSIIVFIGLVTSTHLVSKQSFLLIRLCAQRVQRQAPELELGAGPRHGRDLQIARLPDDGGLRPVRHLAHARSRPPIRRKGEAATTDYLDDDGHSFCSRRLEATSDYLDDGSFWL